MSAMPNRQIPFGLDRVPIFGIRGNREALWTASQKALLLDICDILDRGLPGAYFSGESGSGKTTLLNAVFNSVERRAEFRTSLIPNPSGDGESLLLWLMGAFGASNGKSQRSGPFEGVRQGIRAIQNAEQRPLVLIDEAQTISDAGLTALARLMTMTETDAGDLSLQVVLAGSHDLKARLKGAGTALSGLSNVGALTPMTEEETAEVIRHGIAAAGGRAQDIFELEALALIHQVTGGVPRLVERLCTECLFAAVQAESRIDAAFVRQLLVQDEHLQFAGFAQVARAARKDSKETAERAARETETAPPLRSAAASRRGGLGRDDPLGFLAGALAAAGLLAGAALIVPAHETGGTWPGGEIKGVEDLSGQKDLRQPADTEEVTRQAADGPDMRLARTPLPDTGSVVRPNERARAVSALPALAMRGLSDPDDATRADQVSVAEPPGPDTESRVLDDAPFDPGLAARFYRSGLSQVSARQAVLDFSRAAVAGHGRAAHYLAQMFETGDGVMFAPGTARAWYAFSAAHDGPDIPARADRDDPTINMLPLAEPLFSSRSSGTVVLVWMGHGPFRVELAPRSGPPSAYRDTDLTALRLAAPGNLTWWRLVPANGRPTSWMQIGTPRTRDD